MSSNLSLLSIVRDDPEFGRRISKKVEEIKANKENLLNTADDYGKRYQQEILEGTELKNKLLTEGSSRGLKEEEIMASYGKFVPTVYTPLLNMLYFILRESDDDFYYGRDMYKRRDAINETLVKMNELDHHDNDSIGIGNFDAIFDEVQKKIYKETKSASERVDINKKLYNETKQSPPEDATKLKDPQEMVEFLYGNTTLEKFNLIKKLKHLAQSPNENEAFQAYRKAMELCKEEGLEFDKIPCYVDKRK